jgi:hypothetical protein
MSELDEISQMCEKVCEYLNELTIDEASEVVRHYFVNYYKYTKIKYCWACGTVLTDTENGKLYCSNEMCLMDKEIEKDE